MKKLALALLCVLSLGACAGPQAEVYRDGRPLLDLRNYFNGDIEAQGYFRDRGGKVVKRFKVAIKASWDGDVGTLDEHFDYSDGTTGRRVWTIRRFDEHRYVGQADDVVGEARGEAYGNALRWRYTLKLPVDARVWEVQFDDWMYLMDDTVMLNQSVMSKFGFRLGEVVLTFRKRS